MAIVEIERLEFGYSYSEPVLTGLDLSLTPGSAVGLLGRNGAGKTTLIQLLLGILRPAKGSIRIFGKDPVRDPVEVKRRIGSVVGGQVYPMRMSGYDLAELHRNLYPTWDLKYFNRLANAFELREEQVWAELSTGRKVQLSLACALAHHPEFLILDEPTANLDPVARRTFLSVIVEHLAAHETTLIVSSHQLDDVQRLVQQVAFLDQGRIRFEADLANMAETTTLLRFSAEHGQGVLNHFEGCLKVESVEGEIQALFAKTRQELTTRIETHCPQIDAHLESLTLEEFFLKLLGTGA